MSVVIRVSEVINRPAADVFRFYAHDHVRNHPRWDPDIQLDQVSEGPIGLGTVIRRLNSRSGRPVEGVMKVVEFDPDCRFGVEIQDGPVQTRGRVVFEPLEAGRTRITISAEFPASDDPALEGRLAPLVKRSVRTIKRLVEAEA